MLCYPAHRVLKGLVSPTSKKVGLNTLAQAVRQFATLVLGLLTTALITRYLGRSGYGDYSLARNFMLFFTLGVDFGLNAIVVRGIARKRNLAQRYLENLIALRVLLAFLCILLGIGVLGFTPYPSLVERAVVIALLALIPSGLCRAFNTIFQANLRYDLALTTCVSGELATFGLILLGTRMGLGLLFLVGASLAGGVVDVLIGSMWLRKFRLRLRLGFDWRLWRRLLLAALPLGAMLVFTQITAKTDLFLLSLLPLPERFGLGSRETVGIYSLAYRIFKNAIILPTFFMNALFPVMVADHKEDRERFVRRLKKAVRILLGISALGVIVGFAIAPWVIRIIAGKGFEQSVVALRMLLLGLPFFYLSSPLQWFLVTVGREKILPLIYGAAAVLSVVLNLVFIPRFSYQASAVIVSAIEGFICVGLGAVVWKSSRSRKARAKMVV